MGGSLLVHRYAVDVSLRVPATLETASASAGFGIGVVTVWSYFKQLRRKVRVVMLIMVCAAGAA